MAGDNDVTRPTGQRIRALVINFSCYFLYPGDLDTATGGYHYDRRLIAGLRRLGLEVTTISLAATFPRPDPPTLEATARVLATLPDGATVVIDGLAFGVMDRLAAAEAKRLRLVALCHHPLALESGLDASQQRDFMHSEQSALSHTRAVVVTSEHTRQLFISRFGVSAQHITVALPGTERMPFAACDGNPLRLLTVATLTRRKAHDVLIEALATLTALPWQARFVGGSEFDPGWAAFLEQRVRELHLSERIDFVGSSDSLPSEYANADLFVLPSRFEGYGMVFAEALAAGLPVIAARAGAVPDLVPDTAGLLVAPDDTGALREALQQLLTDATLRHKLQAGARAAAAALPDWDDCARRVLQLLEQVQRLEQEQC